MTSRFHRTILFSSFHVLILRNLLAPVIPLLVKKGVRLVLVAPDYKKEYFESQLKDWGVLVEGVRSYEFSKSFFGLFFKRLSRAILDTDTVRIRMRYKYEIEHRRFAYWFFVLPARILGHFSWCVRLVRFLDYALAPRKGYFFPVFARHRPNLVVVGDANNENDVALLHDAKRAGIKTLAVVRSWDNVTNYLIRSPPDRLIVGNETMKQEIADWHGIPAERVSVCGIPYFDRYLKGPGVLREDFFKSFGLDLQKKLILYGPVADYRIRENDVDPYVIELLARTGENVLVRLPPAVPVSVERGRYPENVFFDQSGKTFFHRGDSELTPEDDERLIAELSYCDMVVSGPGTLNIDASFFDKPIILVNFYPVPRSFLEGIKEYGYTHIRPILSSGGVRMASRPEELFALIRAYAHNPSMDQEGRRRIVAEHCFSPDGHAAERVAQTILHTVSNYGKGED